MKLWIDDCRPAPDGYVWLQTVYDAVVEIMRCRNDNKEIELIDIDHDAGDCAKYGGDYINLLNWLEYNGFNYPIRIHSQNPVGVENMRRIIQKNGWREVK